MRGEGWWDFFLTQNWCTPCAGTLVQPHLLLHFVGCCCYFLSTFFNLFFFLMKHEAELVHHSSVKGSGVRAKSDFNLV